MQHNQERLTDNHECISKVPFIFVDYFNDTASLLQPACSFDQYNDGYYSGTAVLAGSSRGVGYGTIVKGYGVCNDAGSAINPFVAKICDGKNKNCEGLTDEDWYRTWFQPNDSS